MIRSLPTWLVLFGITLVTTSHAAQNNKSPRQAAPIIAVLKAVKAADIKSFRNAYCQRIHEDTNQGDWEKNLKEAQGNLKKLFGDYELKDFAFTFAGDAYEGKVSIRHKGKKSVALAVVREAGEWKINER